MSIGGGGSTPVHEDAWVTGGITPRPLYALDGPVVGCATRRSEHRRQTEYRLAHVGNETATLCFVTGHCMEWEFGS